MLNEWADRSGLAALIFCEEAPLRQALRASLSAMGCSRNAEASAPEDLNDLSATQRFDFALCTSQKSLDALEKAGLDCPVIYLGDQTIDGPAVSLAKPFRASDLSRAVQNALTLSLTGGQDARLQQAL